MRKVLLIVIAASFVATTTGHAASDCEAQKDRFETDYLASIQHGAEAVGKDDDSAYCKAIRQGLATAQAYYDWARQSGCLAGDAAAREHSLQSIKALRDKSRKDVGDDCR